MTVPFTRSGLLILLIMTLIVTAGCAYEINGRTVTDFFSGENRKSGYSYGIPTYWLVGCFAAAFAIVPLMMLVEHDRVFYYPARYIFHTIFIMAVYMSLLTAFAPKLKRHLRATTCITLWLMPNMLYLFLYLNSFSLYNAPVFVIKVPPFMLRLLTIIWLTGFLVTVIRGFAEHRRFKHRLFEDAWEASRHVRNLYLEVQKEMHLKRNKDDSPYFASPYVSPATNTPLAIGFLAESMRVVLPDKEYTDDELRMIFRHELVHIVRRDTYTKLFLLLCRAMCWFLPFAQKATDDAAEEMELSCDEMVLRDMGDAERNAYGRLLLTTASDAAGFTTCLSASAQSMKYRLQRILSQQKRKMGVPLIAAAFLFLVCGSKIVTFAVDNGTMADVLAEEATDLSGYELTGARDSEGNDLLLAHSAEDLTAQLLELHVCRLGEEYNYQQDGIIYMLEYRGEQGNTTLWFTVTDHTVYMGGQGDARHVQAAYYSGNDSFSFGK